MKPGFFNCRFWRLFVYIAIFPFLLNACQTANLMPAATRSPSASYAVTKVLLTPYHTPTASQTPLPSSAATSTPFPTPSATPRSHIVQKGEDMYGIAFMYGLTLQELQAANPNVDPNFISVDMVLQIPASSQSNQTPDVLPSPTPAGALPGSTDCHRTGEGGLWCFTIITNRSSNYIEGVSLRVRLGGEGVQVADGSALTVINLIPPGASIPAAVYFPPPVPYPFEVDVSLETSLPVSDITDRYIPSHVENLVIKIASDGKSAGVTGEITLDEAVSPARVAAAAVAYNSIGDIVGFRCWENNQPSAPITFSFQVYSQSGEISHISVFSEALR